MSDPRGSHVTTFSYDTSGRLTSATYPPGSGSDVLARTNIAVTVPPNNEIGRGYVVTHQRTQNPGEVVETGYQTVFFDSGRQERTILLSNNTIETRVININGSDKTTEPTGVESTLTEGPDGRFGMQAPVTESGSLSTPGGLSASVNEARNAMLLDPNNPLSLTTQTETTTINGRIITRAFDAASRTFTETTPGMRHEVTIVDSQGRPVEHTQGNLTPTEIFYDGAGRLETVKRGTRLSSLTYDAGGRVATVTDPSSRSIAIAYDGAGRVIEQSLPGGRTVAFAYDAVGNMTSITPAGQEAHHFAYGPSGQLLIYAPPDLPSISDPRTFYTYNLSGDLTRITRPDGQQVNLSYDALTGQLLSISIPDGQTSYIYDLLTGTVERITSTGGVTLEYTYDGDLQTAQALTGAVAGTVSWGYDSGFRMTSESVNGGNTIPFTYDVDDLLTGAGSLTLSRNAHTGLLTGTTLNAVTDAIGYNGLGERISYQATVSGSGVYDATYGRDILGRIATLTETINGAAATYGYTYDAAGRLSDVVKNSSTVAQYAYDLNGNRIGGFDRRCSTIATSYDAQERLLEYVCNSITHEYGYSDNGERISHVDPTGSRLYAYDALSNLRSVTLADARVIEYVLDGRSRRIAKKIDGTAVRKFLYGGQLMPVAELDGANTAIARFVYGTRLVPEYVLKGGATYRILTDHLGSVRLVVDSTSGVVAQRLDYDEWGRVLADSNPGFQPFGFAGGLYDPDTGLLHFGAREYDAETGRWLTQDPLLLAALNAYAYAGGDPINESDPSGLVGDSLNDTQFSAQLEGILSRSFQGTFKLSRKIRNDVVCFVVEQATEKAIETGIYILINDLGVPYVGRSIDIDARLQAHARDFTKQITDGLQSWYARFKFVGDGIEVRQAEQFILDYVKKSLNVGAEASLPNTPGILNQRNEIKQFVGKLELCK